MSWEAFSPNCKICPGDGICTFEPLHVLSGFQHRFVGSRIGNLSGR